MSAQILHAFIGRERERVLLYNEIINVHDNYAKIIICSFDIAKIKTLSRGHRSLQIPLCDMFYDD